MDYGSAVAHRWEPKKQATHKPTKGMHIDELHDGTYHIEKHHGNDHMRGSATDLDDVHDALEDYFGSPNEGEEELRRESGEAKND